MRHPRSTLFPYTTLFRSIGRPARPIVLALVGLTLALDVRGGNLNAFGVALSFLAAVGLAVVIVVSSRVIGKGDARPPTLYMAAGASALLLIIATASGDFALPQTSSGWIGFVASSAVYG